MQRDEKIGNERKIEMTTMMLESHKNVKLKKKTKEAKRRLIKVYEKMQGYIYSWTPIGISLDAGDGDRCGLAIAARP